MKIDAIDELLLNRLQVAAFVNGTSIVIELGCAIEWYTFILSQDAEYISALRVQMADEGTELSKWVLG